ncbi:hypothetical protein PPACK8108_LOCUS21875 [Phakopsora pachyrhizi]|uniref:Uncharacterized protein n=1 Tax=Phakopsora pachyrhizi TaxID=170000 RepID=A0AAV0BIU3_PHAPC|nr:hypothetical protein PPACK8108_LOCUS21875 [Phakopsora pachyrhizi]
MRAPRVLKQSTNEVKEISKVKVGNRSERKTDPDPFIYHTKPPSEFWEKFRKKLVNNPESSSGMLLNEVQRWPPPGLIETVQVTPASKASDLAKNPYHERDFRRMYPWLEMIDQSELLNLLLTAPDQLKLPKVSASSSSSTTSLTSGGDGSLSNLFLSSSISESNMTSEDKQFKPPTPPGKPYQYKQSETPPHPKDAYFPM